MGIEHGVGLVYSLALDPSIDPIVCTGIGSFVSSGVGRNGTGTGLL